MDREEICERLVRISDLVYGYDRSATFFGIPRDPFRRLMRQAVLAIRESQCVGCMHDVGGPLGCGISEQAYWSMKPNGECVCRVTGGSVNEKEKTQEKT